jgi:hypothetical protein
VPDRPIVVGDRFAIATDGIQWIVQRRKGQQWLAVKFVRSTKAILAHCLREAGATAAESEKLLADLPARYSDKDGYDSDVSVPEALPVKLYRVRMSDGCHTDLLNLTRAKDLARSTGGTVVQAEVKYPVAAE